MFGKTKKQEYKKVEPANVEVQPEQIKEAVVRDEQINPSDDEVLDILASNNLKIMDLCKRQLEIVGYIKSKIEE